MSAIRKFIGFSTLTRRVALPSIRQPFATRGIFSTTSRFAQGYGDDTGDSRGKSPQEQGPSSRETHNAEHPGPEPPGVGRGTGAGPTKAGTNNSGTKSPEEASAQSGGSRSKEAKETRGLGMGGGEDDNSGASPKIHDEGDPTAKKEKHFTDVKQHNKEFEEGYDRTTITCEDKVDKKFWKGQGGTDRQA